MPGDRSRPSGHETPVVSVIMPFRDAAPYIREAVGSVLRQSLTALDLVLVDDGGTDGSARIAREMAAVDPRARVVAHEGRRRRGTGPSRALGITEARGDLIAFLDADDVWEPHHLSDYVRLLQTHPRADLVCGRAWVWRTWTNPGSGDRLSDLAYAPGAEVSGRRLLAAVLRNGELATPTCSLLARRAALDGVVPHLETFEGLYEDQVINSWLQLRHTAVMSGATSAWYRANPGSISSRLRDEHPARARLAFLTWLEEQLDELGEAPELADLLSLALRETREWVALSSSPRQSRVLGGVLPASTRRRLAGLRRSGRRIRASLSEPGAAEVARALWPHGSDLCGDVLVVADRAAGGVDARPATSLEVRPWPSRWLASGPSHPFATLATDAYDCAVVVPRSGRDGPNDLGLRHLRRALRPAGVLLVVLRRRDSAVAEALRTVFGGNAVSEASGEGRPRFGPLVVVRAFVPAS